MTPLLTDSYGHGSRSGVWISLRSESFLEEWARSVFLSYGCHPEFLDKIFGLLRTSGRYDCCVQSTWIRARWDEFKTAMESAGIQVVTDAYYMPVFK